MTEDDARRQPPDAATQPPVADQPTAGPTPPPPPPPPPSGGYAPPPYAGTGFATRFGLVRPNNGRYLAGVCAAIGRATNTDPVLWRVLFAVLGFFGGVGILAYLVCWLAIPAETDTTSPIESLFGRGRSNTSPVVVILLAVLVALIFGFIVTDGFRAALLGATALIVGALVLSRVTGRGGAVPAGYPAPGMPPAPGPGGTGFGAPGAGQAAPSYPYPPAPAAAATSGPPAGTTASGPAAPQPGYAPPAGGYGAAGAGYGAAAGDYGAPSAGYRPPEPGYPGSTAAYGSPTSPAATAPLPPMPPLPQTPGYRPPFAPHGPYASRAAYPPPPPPAPPKPPKPPKERSALGAATFSLIFVALGVVAVLDLTDTVSTQPSTYFAAALATVALGLLVGAWFGRARWLIALGLVLGLALGVSTSIEHYDRIRANGGSVLWQPAGFEDLGNRYEQRVGDAKLDLSKLDFKGRDDQVTVDINAGKLEVILPPAVDTKINLEVNVGNATVFGRRYDGLGNSNQIADNGTDGVGGGKLTLFIHVNLGSTEVHR